MHRSLWALVGHSSFIEGSHRTKNTASVHPTTLRMRLHSCIAYQSTKNCLQVSKLAKFGEMKKTKIRERVWQTHFWQQWIHPMWRNLTFSLVKQTGHPCFFWFKRVLDWGPEQRGSKLTVLCPLIIIILISYIIIHYIIIKLLIVEKNASRNWKWNSRLPCFPNFWPQMSIMSPIEYHPNFLANNAEKTRVRFFQRENRWKGEEAF